MTTTLDPDLADETAPDRVATAMRAALPCIDLDDSPATLAAHRTDRSAMPGDPDPLVLARPASTKQVSALLAYANAHRIPVVPQGTLTGVAGAASAISGAILLDLAAMDAIIRIDADDMIAVAQPGVIVADLTAAAAKQGLFYAPIRRQHRSRRWAAMWPPMPAECAASSTG